MTCGFMEEIAAAAIFFSPKKNRIRILQKGQHEKYNENSSKYEIRLKIRMTPNFLKRFTKQF